MPFELSSELLRLVSSYIDENYIEENTFSGYGVVSERSIRDDELTQLEEMHCCGMSKLKEKPECCDTLLEEDWNSVLSNLDASFSETLLKLIDKTGKKDSEIYKKANIDRKLFSKIRNNLDYKPSKSTAIAFAMALELNLKDTKDFIARAGYALSHSSKFDLIVEFFIIKKNYNIYELNEVLFAFDQPLIAS